MSDRPDLALDLPRLRRRMIATLFIVAALGSTGYMAAVTAGTLVAAEIAGSAAPGGLPTAATTVGTATAAGLLSLLMLRTGRRPGVLAGISVGVLGGGVALTALLVGSIPLLLLGSALTGFANAAGQLGRYIAADLVVPERRGSTIATVVWGSTIGAVAGPNLIAPAGALGESIGMPPLGGTYLLTVVFIGIGFLVAFVFLRPEPYSLAHRPAPAEAPMEAAPRESTRLLLRRPSVLVALVTLAAGQVVMVLIMTMTPLHLTDHGHGLGTVGFVLSAHTFGMFALSPISGRLADRFGSPRVIAAGIVTLATAGILAALAPTDASVLLALALFLLGYGWNLGFVAGSSLLTASLALDERTRVQGTADGLIWGSAALASLSSGVIVAGASYAALGLLGVALLIVPTLVLAARGAAAHPVRAA